MSSSFSNHLAIHNRINELSQCNSLEELNEKIRASGEVEGNDLLAEYIRKNAPFFTSDDLDSLERLQRRVKLWLNGDGTFYGTVLSRIQGIRNWLYPTHQISQVGLNTLSDTLSPVHMELWDQALTQSPVRDSLVSSLNYKTLDALSKVTKRARLAVSPEIISGINNGSILLKNLAGVRTVDDVIRYLKNIPGAKQHLTKIDLSAFGHEIGVDNIFVGDSQIEKIVGFSNLTDLNLWEWRSINDAVVLEIADQLTKLEVLNLGACWKITDVGVLAIANKLTNLTDLNLNNCDLITDASILAIADKLPKLKLLGLYHCYSVTAAAKATLRQKIPGIYIFG